ncbi:hypothetical protein DXG01_010983 [Tephrocybe rancida]|nr:hypothetical protein DXG01_010983 [Tephrocybe rancida]
MYASLPEDPIQSTLDAPMEVDEPPSVPFQSPSPPPPPAPPSPPQVTATGRPQWRYRLPGRYQDILPEPPVAADAEPEPRPLPTLQRVVLFVRNRFQTVTNSFGLWCEYLYCPSFDPDAFVAPEDLYRNRHTPFTDSTSPLPESPHANESIAMIHEWQNTGSSNKSDPKMNHLVHDVLLHPKFCLEDLAKFNAQRENQHADDADKKSPHLDMFLEASIGIDVPSGDKDVPSRIFDVPGLLYQRLTNVVIAAFNDSLTTKFHLSPYKLFHESPITGKQERVFSEIAELPPDDLGCKCEKVIAALMFWSNSTHLANFGTAKLWPIYLLFGNLSTYLPYLISFKIKFRNSIANYPEKVLLATIRDKGLCPCPWCLIPKSSVDRMGLVYDIQQRITQARKYVTIWVAVARNSIYKQGLGIGSAAVECLLKPTSSVPTVNAFIDRLGSNFPLSDMLVVDLMHEFELGIWKALFIHLIRVLYAVAPDGSLVNELDRRYCQIPTFGLSTIH